MASPPVLAFDAEGRPVKFDTWLDDLHLFLQLTAKEDISLYDHALGHATAPAATADSTARSQWQTRDAHARFAIRNSLPIDEREALWAAQDCTGTGCSPSPLFPSFASAAAVDLLGAEKVGTASASSGRRSGKGKGGKGGGGDSGGGGGGGSGGEVAGAEEVVGVAVDEAAAGVGVVEEVVAGGGVVEALAVARASSTLRRPRSGEGAEYLSVPPDPGIRTTASAAPGIRVSATPGAGEAAALVAVSLADPSGGPVLATSSTVLPCPAVPSGTLSGLHLPSFSTNLVAGCALQDAGVHQFTPAYERVTHCTCARTGRHLATFTRQPGSDLYTLTTAPPQVAASASASASGQLSAPCSCPSLAHEDCPLAPPTWPPVCAAPSCHALPGRQRDRSSLLLVSPDDCSFADAPHGRVGPSPRPWSGARLQLSERFRSDFPVLRLHSDRGGEFSSDLLAAYCAEHGIEQSFTLPASPQQNGVAERRIGLVMEVARTSLDPCGCPPQSVAVCGPDVTFDESVPYYRLFPYRTAPLPPPPLFLAPGAAVVDPLPPQGAAPSSVSQVDPVEPVEVAVDSRPAGGAEPGGADSGGAEPGGAEPGGAVTGVLSLGVLGLGVFDSGGAGPEGATPGRDLSSEQLREWYLQYCSLRSVTSGTRRTTGTGAGTSPPSRELPSRERIRELYERRCTLRSGAPRLTDPAAPGGYGPGVRAAAGAADPGVGAAAGAADPGVGAAAGAADPGVGAAAGCWRTRELEVLLVLRTRALGLRLVLRTLALELLVVLRTRVLELRQVLWTLVLEPLLVLRTRALVLRLVLGTWALELLLVLVLPLGVQVLSLLCLESPARPQVYFVLLLQQVLGLSPPPGPPPLACSQPVPSQLQLQPASPLPAPSPYTGPTGGLTERPSSFAPGTHRMSLRPSTAPLRAPLLSPPASSLPALAEHASDSLRAASPTVTRLLATAVTDPSFESSAASSLVAELVDFAAHCRLDYAASLLAESEFVCPPSVGGVCALGTDVLEDRQEEFQCLAAASPHLVSVLLTPEGDPDALDIPTPRSYAEAIEGSYSSQVKRPPGSPPVFKARYVARGFSQRQGVDYFQTFSPTSKMTTLRVLLHVAAHRDYELHSLDFSTAFLQGSLHEEIWLRRPPGITGSFPPGTQWSLRRPVYDLRQAPREWHDTLRTTLAALGFAPSTADPSLFLRTDTSLPPFYILVYVDDLVFATADTTGLAHVKSELQKRHTCTDLGELRSYLGLQITRDRARRTITLTQSHMVQQVLQRFGFTYSSPQATPLSTRHSLSALPSDESVESSGPYPELVGCLMYLMT
ncbi:unnamed protein product [Closterium sp. NIES-64]|nr:unnamed protein product [Closterium sp. NIES-64]